MAGRASCIEFGSSEIDRVENQSSLRNRRENAKNNHAALEVSQEVTAICVIDEADRIVAEKKIASCLDVIAAWLTKNAPDLARAGTSRTISCFAMERASRQRSWTPSAPMRSRRHLFLD
jgi:hypothetical protein